MEKREKIFNRVEGALMLIIIAVALIIIFVNNQVDYMRVFEVRSLYKSYDYEFDEFWNYRFQWLCRLVVSFAFFYWLKSIVSNLFIKKTETRYPILRIFLFLLIGTALLTIVSLNYDHKVAINLLEVERNVGYTGPFSWSILNQYFSKYVYIFLVFVASNFHFLLQVLAYFLFYNFLRVFIIDKHYFNKVKTIFLQHRTDITIAFAFSILVVLVTTVITLLANALPFFSINFKLMLLLFSTIILNITFIYNSQVEFKMPKRIWYGFLFQLLLVILFVRIPSSLFNDPLNSHDLLVDLFVVTFWFFTCSHVLTYPYYFFTRKFRSKRQELILENSKSKSELSLLKSQINPHFLFNSLNTVYGLALNEESPKTAHAVQQLSEMMRFMLHENHAEKIPLQKEIDYLRNYIELQTLRISQKDHFQLEVDVAEGCQGEITPMVLIPFVENAFKHGVSFQKPSWVKIKLTCNAEEVHLNVQNSVHKHAEDPEKGKSGIGLENVRKRLGILYPEKHLFQIYETEDSFEANIKITLI